jgi:integrase
MKQLLTDRTLRALKPAPEGKRVVIWDAALPSFGVRVTDTGRASFFVMRRAQGEPKPVRVVLGPYPALSLSDARERARQALSELSAGINPARRKAVQRATEARLAQSTVAAVAEDFIRRHAAKKRTGAAIGQLIRRELVSRWGTQPIAEITRGDVIRMVEEIADSSPSAARQAWIYANRLFGWALNRGTYGLTASPCERINITDLVGSPKARERILADEELRTIWRVTEAGHFPFDPFVRLLIVLGCRRGELAGMRRDELDLAAGHWHLPGDRTKNEQPRTLPLSKQAIAILASLPAFSGPFIFTTTSGERPISGFAKLKERLDRRLATEAPPGLLEWTLHDLRRTMRTHLSALPISGTVAELMIGHKQRGIRAVYDRWGYLEEQRAGFELWAARLRDLVEPAPENVTVLRRTG